MLVRIPGADAAHISDIVAQRGQNGMEPIAGSDDPLEAAAAQYVLDAKRDQGRVLAIVVESIAAGDALDDKPGGFVQDVGNARTLLPIDPAVGLRQVPAQCIS